MIETNRTQSPYVKALACSAFTFALALCALYLGYTLPSFTTSTEAVSQLLALVMVPGLIVGLLAKKSTKAWPIWLIICTFVALLVVITIVHEITAPMRS
ncbi:hypothetical protein [Phyllobacterium endophyticum]|jgi:hypothetical protein|uniref:Uncharacterized protein n=1 Tax=Phyllobacterium endophyticum TaxID=1149773 RepID=A0A2P7B0R6_9HYPH|nr:hypothetical protein [Phyllobacterium endophyticum]MBB3237598.1 uncharacterized membrane protein YcaP (DUF421 family) [Phyllobacterium endophyticum]PSH60067.1 hypothetical protein CU100_04960 [Phyllobacterium endophyticum]TYR42236.1 hypothetical protein FY050_13550 [Phyllobacterium endophyticum]